LPQVVKIICRIDGCEIHIYIHQGGNTIPYISGNTAANNQQAVQFPVFQGERVSCDDNTSLGEFTLAPIPPMKAGEAVLEVVFEVDVNGILKVTATKELTVESHLKQVTFTSHERHLKVVF
jgi:molecular chaperone DnaK (HSP70)